MIDYKKKYLKYKSKYIQAKNLYLQTGGKIPDREMIETFHLLRVQFKITEKDIIDNIIIEGKPIGDTYPKLRQWLQENKSVSKNQYENYDDDGLDKLFKKEDEEINFDNKLFKKEDDVELKDDVKLEDDVKPQYERLTYIYKLGEGAPPIGAQDMTAEQRHRSWRKANFDTSEETKQKSEAEDFQNQIIGGIAIIILIIGGFVISK